MSSSVGKHSILAFSLGPGLADDCVGSSSHNIDTMAIICTNDEFEDGKMDRIIWREQLIKAEEESLQR